MKTLHKPQADTSLSFPSTHFQDSLCALALSHHVEMLSLPLGRFGVP